MARQRKRREWGSGSAFQDKHGQWWAKIQIGEGRTRRAHAATAKEAEQILAAWRQELAEGVDLRASKQRCDHYLDGWLVGLQDRKAVAPRTLEFYQRHASYAAACFGHVAMENLEPRHWRDAQATLLKDGLSRRSVNHVQTVIGTAFKVAVNDRIIKENPFDRVDRLSLGDDAFEAHALDDAEISAFIAACTGERLGILFLFILDYGLRHGEARALKRDDVFLDAVDRQGQPDPHFVIRKSKSKAGRRKIPLTLSWVDPLRLHYATVDDERSIADRHAIADAKRTGTLRPQWVDHGFVFPSERGTMLGEQNVTKIKQRVLQRAGLCDPCLACGQTGKDAQDQRCKACVGRGVLVWKIRIHDLRHTAISEWVAAAGDPKTAQLLAGHGDASVTMNVYAKGREGKGRDALERTAVAREQRKSKDVG